MSGFSTYLDNKILGHVFNGTAYATPAKYWALFTSAKGLTDNSSAKDEVTGEGYARVKAENSAFTTPSASVVNNANNIEFPVAISNWGRVTHVAIMDAATDGNVLAWGTIRNPQSLEERPRVVDAGDQFIIRAGTSSIRITDSATV
jgi:hypothetical protein